MKIIDVHTHIFPEKIAAKATGHISEFYDTPICYNADVQTLLQRMDANGITGSIVFSAATTVEQVTHINDFLHRTVTENNQKLMGFFTLHPHMEETALADEFQRAVSMGFKGIKLHPDFQEFAIDDPAAFPIYELAQQNGVPILFHTGDNRFAYSNPHRLAKIMQVFPHLTVIGAHFGGWSEWDEAVEVLAKTENLFFDTSSTRAFIPLETIRKSVHTFGADRLLFGTDFPMWDAEDELPFIDRLGLHESEKEKVLCANACNLLGIEL